MSNTDLLVKISLTTQQSNKLLGANATCPEARAWGRIKAKLNIRRRAQNSLEGFIPFIWSLQDQGLISAPRKRAIAAGLGNEFRPVLVDPEGSDRLPAYCI